MKVLGLCFLINDNINHEELWYNWLKNVDSKKYRVYIHYKNNIKLKYFEEYKLDNCIETKYGKYTITLAQNLMMKQGLDVCSHFIFLSGSCIPLKPFTYIYDYLSVNNSYFNKAPDRQCFPRCNDVLKHLDKNFIKKANTNSIICNNHAKKIIDNEDMGNKYFGNIVSADEHIHISILYYLNLENELILTPNTCYSGATTFTAWEDMADFKAYKDSIKQNSYTYIHICKEEMDDLINGKCLFGRKFKPECKVIKNNIPSVFNVETNQSLLQYLTERLSMGNVLVPTEKVSVPTEKVSVPTEKVSVVIPTYNRFKYLMNTIQSVKEQTYTNIEIIVVNDCSTETEYYQYNWTANGIHFVHLPENSKVTFGYACAGFVRNKGIEVSNGKHIAFCDDDDIWFPQKIELQLKAMKENDCKMSCTDGLMGRGIYDNTKTYKKYNKEHYFNTLKRIYKQRNSPLMDDGFPIVWTPDFFKVHNCAICSSVMVDKEILDKIDNFKNKKPPGEDYDCWLRAIQHTNCAYVDEPCMYYDSCHGAGQNY